MDVKATRTVLCGRTALIRAVKSCGPDLPTLRSSRVVANRAATGARKPGSWGEREISRKAIAQGRPDRWLNLWFLPRAFLLHGGHGSQSRPGLPCALSCQRAQDSRMSRVRSRRERADRCLKFAGHVQPLCGAVAAAVSAPPPPLRGRVGEGVPRMRCFRCGPPPTPPRKGEGSRDSPRMTMTRKRAVLSTPSLRGAVAPKQSRVVRAALDCFALLAMTVERARAPTSPCAGVRASRRRLRTPQHQQPSRYLRARQRERVPLQRRPHSLPASARSPSRARDD